MRQTRRIERNSAGAWTAIPQDQTEVTAGYRDDIEEQRQTQSQTFDIFALKRWKIQPTIDRTQICFWALMLITKLLSILTMISFWISLFLVFKSSIVWKGPHRIVTGFLHRRNQTNAGVAVSASDGFWEDVFPSYDSISTYQLHCKLTSSAYDSAKTIYDTRLPLLLDNPVIWSFITLILLIGYHLLSFVHDCLQQASRTTRTLAKKTA